MLISYNWLKKFITLDKTATEVADKITLSLAEVEKVKKVADDFILEIENKGLTHRPDCFSHLGIAREVSAFFKAKLNNPLEFLLASKLKAEKKLPVTIEVTAKESCPVYCGVVLADLKVKNSPNWLRGLLERVGVRSINNVVDITNYVMLELGQPLHAFDYDKVENGHIIVRKAKKGEKLVTLDGNPRDLNEDMLVIADTDKPIGLAGIMGGENTQVDQNTKTIILEAANFEAKNNRKTSKKLNLRTEASTRFEKNLDITLPLPSIKMAIKMLKTEAEAKQASQIIKIENQKFKPKKVTVKTEWINRFIGFKLSQQETVSILNRLGFSVCHQGGLLKVVVPSWRQDVSMPADLAEEVARVYGYDKVPITLPNQARKPATTNVILFWRKKVKQLLKALSFTEVLSQPFVGQRLLEKTDTINKPHLQLINPLTVDQEFMRRCLLPSLLEITQENLKYFPKFRLYELNRVFIPQKDKAPKEIPYLSGVMVEDDFFRAKGVVELLLSELGIKNTEFKPLESNINLNDKLFDPFSTAQVLLKNDLLGLVGTVRAEILLRFHIDKDLTIFDLNFGKLAKLATSERRFQPLPKYPPIIEDLTLIIPSHQPIGPVIKSIKKQSQLIKDVSLYDEYQRNFTFRITYQHHKRTLTNQEIKRLREKIIATIEPTFAVKVKRQQ